MNYDVIGFPIALLFILSLLFWIIIKIDGKVFHKVALIGVTGLVFFMVWGSISNLKGWAAEGTHLPDKYLIHWIVVNEPSKVTNTEGGIFLLVSDISKDDEENKGEELKVYVKGNEKEPRLFKIPYSREMHKQAQEMINGLKKGKRFIGEKAKENKKGGKNKEGFKYPKMKQQFYEMPKPPMPKKNR